MKVLTFGQAVPLLEKGQSIFVFNPGERYLVWDCDTQQVDLPSAAFLGKSDLEEYLRHAKKPRDWRGRRVLFATVGGLGDQVIFSSLLRYYNEVLGASVFVGSDIRWLTFFGYNRYVAGGSPVRLPMSLDSVWRESGEPFFDWCFFRESIAREGMPRGNAYDQLFAEHGFEVPADFKRGNACIHPSELKDFRGRIAQRGLERFILIQPFASTALRSLPPHLLERVLEGANEVAQRHGLKLLIVHNKPFSSEVVALTKRIPTAVLLSALPLRDFISLVSQAVAVVSVDSSAYHVAAAFGTPAVVLWGTLPPESMAKYYPKQLHLWHRELCAHSPCWFWGVRGTVPAHLCPKGAKQVNCECLEGITAQEVTSSLEELLK